MVNKVILIGNLGKDPETKYTPNGASVSTFSIACAEHYKDKEGNKKEKTEWVSIIAWNKLSELVSQYLRKGSKVYIEGKLATQSWERGGQKHYKTQVVAQIIKFLSPQQKSNQQDNSQQSFPTDDLPF
jgi:single-strand DNA-binding protein